MGTYTIDTGNPTTSNTVKARASGSKVFEDSPAGTQIHTLTFETAGAADETFELEIRPQEPEFDTVQITGANSTQFTELSSSNTTLTCQKMTFTTVTTVSFKVSATDAPSGVANGGTARVSTWELVPTPDGNGDSGPGDGVPIKIKVVVVHPTAIGAGMSAGVGQSSANPSLWPESGPQ